MMNDISPRFRPDDPARERDSEIAREILALEGTPQAIVKFAERCNELSAYAYWFYLSTLWVSYTGWSDLNLWRRLFSSRRPHRTASIMKPSEMKVFRELTDPLTVYRAHRPGETDWIAYTFSPLVVRRLARERGGSIRSYTVKKKDVLALFLRRNEEEVLVLDRSKATFRKEEDPSWSR